jgi:hypothetical protein
MEVYRSYSYKNDWNADGLPSGTYFYTIKVNTNDGKTLEKKGYITVIRK